MFLEWRINHDRGLLFTGYPTNSNDRDSMHNTCLLMFSAHNTFLYFLDRDSIKSRDIWKKFVSYVLGFPLAGTYGEKFVSYVLCFPLPGTYAQKMLIMSHLDAITGHFRCFFVHMSYLSYARGYFVSFFSICPT